MNGLFTSQNNLLSTKAILLKTNAAVMKAINMEELTLGPYCMANNITVEKILNAEPYSLDITNGVALEISEAHPMLSGLKSNLQLIMRLGGYSEVEIRNPKLINRLRTRLGRAAKRSKKYKPEKRPEFMNMDFLDSERKFRADGREASSTPPLDAHPPPPHSMCASTSSSLPSCSTGSPRLPVDDADSGEDDNPEDDNFFRRNEVLELGRGKRYKTPQCWAPRARKPGLQLTAASSKKKRKLCSSPSPETEGRSREPQVNFQSLKLDSLRHYGRHFKMNHSTRLTKSELVDMCTRHFSQIEVNPDEVMKAFMKKVKER